jgi:hypothetical protein
MKNAPVELLSAWWPSWRTVEFCPRVRPILAATQPGDFPVSVSPEDLWLQGEGDLGQRIERILGRALLQAPAAIAIGADSPALTAAHLEAALDAVQANDAVVGPSTDDGFYLLALHECRPGIFSSLPWSTSETWQALKRRMEEYGLSTAELEPLFDVDTSGVTPITGIEWPSRLTVCRRVPRSPPNSRCQKA